MGGLLVMLLVGSLVVFAVSVLILLATVVVLAALILDGLAWLRSRL